MVEKNKLSRNFKKLDFFSTNVTFRENGGDAFGSIFGAFLSLAIALVVLLYGSKKFVTMYNYEDT